MAYGLEHRLQPKTQHGLFFASGGLDGRHHDSGDLIGLFHEICHSLLLHQASLDEQFQPIGTFVTFLFDDAELGDELSI